MFHNAIKTSLLFLALICGTGAMHAQTITPCSPTPTTTTPTLGLNKPGNCVLNFGTLLNQNSDKLDAAFSSLSTYIGFIPLNPINNLSDTTDPALALQNLGGIGWLVGTGSPVFPCSGTQNNGAFYTSNTLTLYQCSSVTGTYHWNLIGGVGPGVVPEITSFETTATIHSIPGMTDFNGFSGATPQAKFTTAIGDAGSSYQEEIVVGANVPGGTSTSYPSANTPLNSYVHVLDERGTNNQDWTGSYSGNGNNNNALGLYGVETRQDDLISTGSVLSGVFNPGYKSLSGGVYNFVGSGANAPTAWSSVTTYYFGQLVTYSGNVWTAIGTSTNQTPAAGSYWISGGNTKSTRFVLADNCAIYTVAQNLCNLFSVWSHSSGEADGIFSYVVQEGGNQSPGQEPSVALRGQVQQYESSPSSSHGVWAAIAATVTGLSPTFTVTTSVPSANPTTLGERIVRDLSKKVSGIGFSIGSSGVLTMTGGGLSSFPRYATGTAFTRMNLGIGFNNEILAIDAIFCTQGVAGTGEFGSGFDYCVPIESFTSDSVLTVWSCQLGSGCQNSFTPLLEATSASNHWAVYASALATGVNATGTAFTAQGAVADTSIPISNGDSLDQPLAYNTGMGVSYSSVYNAVSTSSDLMGYAVYALGAVGSNDETSAPPMGNAFYYEGNVENGLGCYPSAPTTTSVQRYCINMTPTWAYTGFANLPSTAPTAATYPLLGSWLEFMSGGAALQLGGSTEGASLNLSNGNLSVQGSISSPSGGVGAVSQLVSDSTIQAGTPNTSTGNAYWILSGTTAGASVTPNATADPLTGASDAFRFTAGTLTGAQTVGIQNQGYTLVSVTSGEVLAGSIWLKAATSGQGAEITFASSDSACQSSTVGGGQLFVPNVPTSWTFYNWSCTFSTTTTVQIFVGAALAAQSGTSYYAFNPQIQVGPAVTQQFCSNPSPFTGSGFILNCRLQPNLMTMGAAVAFSSLPTCAAGIEGATAAIKDSTTNTWGATITGSGSDHVQGYCDGTNWTVGAK